MRLRKREKIERKQRKRKEKEARYLDYVKILRQRVTNGREDV